MTVQQKLIDFHGKKQLEGQQTIKQFKGYISM